MATRGIPRTTLGEGASHEGFLRHKGFRWLKIALLLCIAAALAYALIDVQPRPNGGSWYGYTLGTIATLHTGFQFGWNVHTLAYVLMMLVILSGIYGIVAYSILPEELSASRGEMTRPQMIDAVQKLDRQLQLAAQPLGHEDTAIVSASIAQSPFKSGLLRRLSGRNPRCRTDRALQLLRPRLVATVGPGGEALEAVVALLERKAAALGRIRRHLRLKALLEVWLYVHVPLTFALIAALAAHIVSVFFYW